MFFSLTETWHVSSEDTCLRLATPVGYAVVDVARTSGRGGGVAIIHRQHLKSSVVPVSVCRTMEVLCVRLLTSDGPVIILNVHRPGSERPSTEFFDELASVLETLVVYSCPVVIGGDFNVKAQDVNDSDSRRLTDLLTSFDMVLNVRSPTHRCGNTLDLVVTSADRCPVSVIVDPPGVISDHALVVCQMPLNIDQPSPVERLVRGWRRVNRTKLRRALEKVNCAVRCLPTSTSTSCLPRTTLFFMR
jgi:endonuclease/exonuclease/phosphatase family metal-dependent hydrolase